MTHHDVIICGAGASGLFCAAECARQGKTVLTLDHAAAPAPKVAIAGGGRCNVTNAEVRAEDYLGENPHFVKSALARFTPDELLQRMRAGGLSPMLEEEGKWFCAEGGKAVAAWLLREAEAAGAQMWLDTAVEEVRAEGAGFAVETSRGGFKASSLVLATGGLAWPQLGATNFAYAAARRFGLRVTPLAPGLTPLLAPAEEEAFCRGLAGVSLRAGLRTGGARVEGSLLFTHRGLSGPAALEASLRWRDGAAVAVDWLPGVDPAAMVESAPTNKKVSNVLAEAMPRGAAEALCARLGLHGPAGRWRGKALRRLTAALREDVFRPAALAGYAKAEVTRGGVATSQLSSRTMAAHGVPGLYILGEALDVTGRLGGFNLHWAWASGHAAGCAIGSGTAP